MAELAGDPRAAPVTVPASPAAVLASIALLAPVLFGAMLAWCIALQFTEHLQWGMTAVNFATTAAVGAIAAVISCRAGPDQAAVLELLAGDIGGPGNLDGIGAAARFNGPEGVAVDGDGNVYVADRGSSTIRKVTPDGVVTTLAGLAGASGGADGTGPEARFFGPSGIATDRTGTV